MLNDFSNMTVVVTGGTQGVGLSVVESFVQMGAKVYATYLWGNDLESIKSKFSRCTNPPTFVQADVKSNSDTDALIKEIQIAHGTIDVLVSNAAVAGMYNKKYKYRDLINSIQYNAWPLLEYMDAIKLYYGEYPRYVVAITSEGHRSYHIQNYDYVAASKAVLETLVKYISVRENININCVSPGFVNTEAFKLVFGEKVQDFLDQHSPDSVVPPTEIGNTVLSLCSGLMDGVNGQVILVDRGKMFSDNSLKWQKTLSESSER